MPPRPQKLDGSKKRRRLRRNLMWGAWLLAVATLYAVNSIVYAERELAGVVRRAQLIHTPDKSSGYRPDVEVALDNGALVRLAVSGSPLPEAGTRVAVIEETHVLGLKSYRWAGTAK